MVLFESILPISHRLLLSLPFADVAQAIMPDVAEVDRLPGHPQAVGGLVVDPQVPHAKPWSCRVTEDQPQYQERYTVY